MRSLVKNLFPLMVDQGRTFHLSLFFILCIIKTFSSENNWQNHPYSGHGPIWSINDQT